MPDRKDLFIILDNGIAIGLINWFRSLVNISSKPQEFFGFNNSAQDIASSGEVGMKTNIFFYKHTLLKPGVEIGASLIASAQKLTNKFLISLLSRSPGSDCCILLLLKFSFIKLHILFNFFI